MQISVTVEQNIDPEKFKEAVESRKVWLYAAESWHRLYHKYVPFDHGALRDTVSYDAKKSTGIIHHSTIYAHYQYEGYFHHRKNPLASRHWDEAAVPTEMPKLIRELGKKIESEVSKL